MDNDKLIQRICFVTTSMSHVNNTQQPILILTKTDENSSVAITTDTHRVSDDQGLVAAMSKVTWRHNLNPDLMEHVLFLSRLEECGHLPYHPKLCRRVQATQGTLAHILLGIVYTRGMKITSPVFELLVYFQNNVSI